MQWTTSSVFDALFRSSMEKFVSGSVHGLKKFSLIGCEGLPNELDRLLWKWTMHWVDVASIAKQRFTAPRALVMNSVCRFLVLGKQLEGKPKILKLFRNGSSVYTSPKPAQCAHKPIVKGSVLKKTCRFKAPFIKNVIGCGFGSISEENQPLPNGLVGCPIENLVQTFESKYGMSHKRKSIQHTRNRIHKVLLRLLKGGAFKLHIAPQRGKSFPFA